MNESIIKEIKTIYSGRSYAQNPPVSAPEIKKPAKRNSGKNKTFFNGVIEKLDIIVTKPE